MSPSSRSPARTRTIHIDTDPGLDDLLALALAFACPEIHVCGITTVAGNVGLETVTENALRFLDLVGLDVPVGRGAAGPLALDACPAEHVHGVDGRAGIEFGRASPAPLPDALEVLHESLTENRADTVVALGPLTNIANLLTQDARAFRDAELVWMGGTLGDGNVTPLAEFNAHADPHALEIVLRSRVPMRIIGLDVTHQVWLRREDLDGESFGRGPVARVLAALVEALMDAGIPTHGEPTAVLHDPCAIVAAAMSDWFRYDWLELSVDLDAGRERGRMRAIAGEPGTSVRYALEVRSEAVRQFFVERVLSWSDKVGGR